MHWQKKKSGNTPTWLGLTVVLLVLTSCGRLVPVPKVNWEDTSDPPDHFPYEIDAREPCWLKIDREERPVFRVNCFAIDGTLHTHSSRYVPIANLLGGSWTRTVAEHPDIKVYIEDKVYPLTIERIHNEDWRVQVLIDRGYPYVPDAIQVYKFSKSASVD